MTTSSTLLPVSYTATSTSPPESGSQSLAAPPWALELLAKVDALQAEVSALKTTTARAPKALLSLRQAAARLGVDRGTTLRDLITSGQLQTVTANDKTKVPASEVERLSRTGFDSSTPIPSRRRAPTKKNAPRDWSALKAFKVAG